MTENQLQEQVVARYADNLVYLQNSHPQLYKNLMLLDIAIDQGDYEERYALEYRDDAYFDIRQIVGDTYLYGENSEDFAKAVIPDALTEADLHKAIFFGAALGTHVTCLAERIERPAIFWIVEDDLELFRLSLFVTDFAQIAANGRLFFSVMEEEAAMHRHFLDFYREAKEYNENIPYFTFYDRYLPIAARVREWIAAEKAALTEA